MTSRGSPILPSHVRRLCGRLAEKAGIEGRIHPHALRHTFAAEWYREQPDRIVELMLALGHTKITVTQRYLRDIGSTDVVKLSINRSW
jgi:integrase